MSESRWILRLAPTALGVVVVGLLATVSSAAGLEASSVPVCSEHGSPTTALRAPVPREPEGIAGSPWYQLDPVLDDTSGLVGQRLVASLHGRPGGIAIELPPESFAAGPFGELVLYGADDGERSELWLLDLARECRLPLGTTGSVIRSATIDPSGAAVYEHRVDRATRADLGVVRRTIATGEVAAAVPPIPVDQRFGPTFGTLLAWSSPGDRLAVHSCGALRCRLRVHDPATGRTTVGPEGVGELVGVVGDSALVYGDCLGLPCPILAIDLRSDRRLELAAAAGLATIADGAGGPRLVHETSRADALRVVRPDGSDATIVSIPPGGLRLMPASPRAGAGSRIPAGWVLLARPSPAGRYHADRLVLLRLSDGTTTDVPEVIR